MPAHAKLTNLQHELLRVFKYDLKEDQLVEIKNLLADYFSNKLSHEMDELWKKNNWNEETINQWSKEHMRTPYK
jgi:hypothetical protein